MGHPLIEQRLEEQRGVVAAWQLPAAECSRSAARHAFAGMRQVHDGVYLSGHAPPTDWQTWKAATLTTPTTVLGDWSSASFLGMRERADRQPTTVRRPGNGGSLLIPPRPGRCGSLLIRRSSTLGADTKVVDGIPTTAVSRTLLNLIAQVRPETADRMVRDVLRLKLATVVELRAQVAVSRGDRGVARMRTLLDEYAPLPTRRGRSDAEILALAILATAGIVTPLLNVKIAGVEADLVWPLLRYIIELDGPQYHQFPTHEARKQARWETAGWTVARLPTDDVYDHPHRLLALAPTTSPNGEIRLP